MYRTRVLIIGVCLVLLTTVLALVREQRRSGSLGAYVRHGPPTLSQKRDVAYRVDICEWGDSPAITRSWTETASLFAPSRGTRRYLPGMTGESSGLASLFALGAATAPLRPSSEHDRRRWRPRYSR